MNDQVDPRPQAERLDALMRSINAVNHHSAMVRELADIRRSLQTISKLGYSIALSALAIALVMVFG